MNPKRDWDEFWFGPIGGTSLALFRFLFGITTIVGLALLWPDRVFWFTDAGPYSYSAAQAYIHANGANPILPYSPLNGHTTAVGISIFFVLLMLASLSLSVGFCTRTSALLVNLGLDALQNRNNQIMNGADVVFVVMAFYLILAPAGAVFSVDRLIRLARGKEPEEPRQINPWAQRLIQIQLSVIYLAAVLSKLTGNLWVTGMAVYYPLNYPELRRFPVPHIGPQDIWLINLVTYGAIAIELGLVFFVWHPKLRLYALTAGVLLHGGIEYAINVPMFAGIMCITYVTFLTDGDWMKLKRSLKRRYGQAKLKVITGAEFNPRTLRIIRRFDVLGLVDFAKDPQWQDKDSVLHAVDATGRTYLDRLAVREISGRMPIFWPLRLISWFPGGNAWAEILAKNLVAEGPSTEPSRELENSSR
jgi:hypothetical protein